MPEILIYVVVQFREFNSDRARFGAGDGGGSHLAAAHCAAAVRSSRSELVTLTAPASGPTPPSACSLEALPPASRGLSGCVGVTAGQSMFASIEKNVR